MSHPIVRSEIRRRLREVFGSLAVNYQDSINVDVDRSYETWGTVEFYAFDNTLAGYSDGQGRAENGTATVYVFTRAGTGDEQVTLIATEIGDYFFNNSRSTSSADVVITKVGPLGEAFEGDAQHWYGVEFSMEYQANV